MNMYSANTNNGNLGPIDSTRTPRYSGIATFARLPRLDECVDGRADIAVLGMPFDAAVTYRPGARFGPAAIREASRLLRPYNPSLDIEPFAAVQVADAGDVSCHPFDIGAAVQEIETVSRGLTEAGTQIVALGGDHSIALPLLRTAHAKHGPLALLHFDAHLDTWPEYFGTRLTHGTPFRLAFEEGLIDRSAIAHIGTRGPLYGPNDLRDDSDMGFIRVSAAQVMRMGPDAVVEELVKLIGSRPTYVSVDIDVLDPGFAPGTGTPEVGGLDSRELLEIIRGLSPIPVIGADVVEVSPPYDHANVTALAAGHVAYELISVMAGQIAERKA